MKSLCGLAILGLTSIVFMSGLTVKSSQAWHKAILSHDHGGYWYSAMPPGKIANAEYARSVVMGEAQSLVLRAKLIDASVAMPTDPQGIAGLARAILDQLNALNPEFPIVPVSVLLRSDMDMSWLDEVIFPVQHTDGEYVVLLAVAIVLECYDREFEFINTHGVGDNLSGIGRRPDAMPKQWGDVYSKLLFRQDRIQADLISSLQAVIEQRQIHVDKLSSIVDSMGLREPGLRFYLRVVGE